MFFKVILLLLLSCPGIIRCDGFYKVIGPRVVRPNSEFHVAVSTQATSVPTTIAVAVVGTSLRGEAFTIEDRAIILPYNTNIIRLQIGNISDGYYKLIARGTGGVQFQSTAPLTFIKKSYSVFIQTDKSIYKPGDKILFRSLILNSDLKPAADARNEPLNLYITDGNRNKVKEWRNIYAVRGVFSEELQLSSKPVLGNWNISVNIHDQVFNKTIQVMKYILPKYLIEIEVPKHFTFQENILRTNIKAKYNSGKKVKGDATVTVYPTINSGVIQPIFQTPIRKVYPIDGTLSVTFDIAKELKLSDEYERTIIIDVTIEEANTGRRQNNSVEVQLHKYDYKMDLVKTADYFKPGMIYTAFVKVTNHDGSPLKTDRKTVNIRYGFSRVDEVYTKEKIVLDRNGLYKLELLTPSNSNNETALRIEAEYYDLKERLPPVPAAVSLSHTFLQATLITERPIVNLDVEIALNCTESMKYIMYELIGRGDIIIANTFKIDNLKEYSFHFTATHAMVPISHLLVSYVREDGELVSDSIDIQVEGILQNFIDIQTNALETTPETDIDLTIRAQPNSYIGLLAVDENVLKLKSGNDLSLHDVDEELNLYDPSMISPYVNIMKGTKLKFVWKQGASNTRDMYFDSGVNLLTNSLVSSRRPTLEDIYLRPLSYDSSTVKSDRGIGLSIHTVTRPPLAGPYAFSRIPKPVWNIPKVYLGENIQDTWLFNNFSSGFEGKTSIRRRIPNSLNTWMITGFSLNPLHGLGLISSPKRIKVMKLFGVQLDFPQFIQRGEIVAIEVIVFNNMDKDINAEVTLHNSEQKFFFTDSSNEINATVKKIELYRKKRVSVKKNNAASVTFMISTITPGLVEIRVSANSNSNQDSVSKFLEVKAEGETLYFTKTLLIDLTKSNVYKGNVSFTIPKNVVPNSEKIEVSAVGDLLGHLVMNMNHLVRLPIASSEQNLINFVPNLIMLKYLGNTQQLSPTFEKEAITLLESSYQQQLTYKRNDGSFSIFGNENENGSIWITAYTSMVFVKAEPYIFVDKNIIDRAYEWLQNMQNKNGSFFESYPIIHKDLQNPDKNSLALTAFVVLSFMENEIPISRYSNVINKGVDYIARNIDENLSEYTVAICSYVLHLANHPSKLSSFNLLDSKAKTKDGMKWWGKPVPTSENKNPWNTLPKSMDIETTSYALLTMLEANLINDAVPVLHWLLNQRNNLGGFASTQDTQVGLYALYKMVLKLSTGSNVQIEFMHRKQETQRFNINRDNALIVQKSDIGSPAREINVTASGSGLALFQVSYQYNVNVTGPWPLFTLDPQVDKNSNQYHLQLSICSAFVTKNLTNIPASNMAVMEVNLPSGFTADIDALPSLEDKEHVEKVVTKNFDTTIILYFNNMTVKEYCPTISAFRTHRVANLKPVPVIVYDYYDSSRHARILYKGRQSTLCNICEDDDCSASCISEVNEQRAEASREGKNDCKKWNATFSLIAILVLLNVVIY